MPAAALIVFAKYPTPGAAKTRLIPEWGAEGAARLAEAFLLDLLERLTRTDFAVETRKVLCFTPPTTGEDERRRPPCPTNPPLALTTR